MNRKPEQGELQTLLGHTGLAVGIWTPGDGKTRYRFFPSVDGSLAADYHAGDGLYTALGRGEAVTWLRGYRAARVSRGTGSFAALNVLLLNAGVVTYLKHHDPKALVQALRAVGRDTTDAERYCAGGDRCDPRPRYTLRYRPPSFAALPRDIGWTLIERPAAVRDYDARTDLPQSRHPFGVIEFDRRVSDAEVERYDLLLV